MNTGHHIRIHQLLEHLVNPPFTLGTLSSGHQLSPRRVGSKSCTEMLFHIAALRILYKYKIYSFTLVSLRLGVLVYCSYRRI